MERVVVTGGAGFIGSPGARHHRRTRAPWRGAHHQGRAGSPAGEPVLAAGHSRSLRDLPGRVQGDPGHRALDHDAGDGPGSTETSTSTSADSFQVGPYALADISG